MRIPSLLTISMWRVGSLNEDDSGAAHIRLFSKNTTKERLRLQINVFSCGVHGINANEQPLS